MRVDVSQAAQLEKMGAGAVAKFGGIDVILNNAGFSHCGTPM